MMQCRTRIGAFVIPNVVGNPSWPVALCERRGKESRTPRCRSEWQYEATNRDVGLCRCVGHLARLLRSREWHHSDAAVVDYREVPLPRPIAREEACEYGRDVSGRLGPDAEKDHSGGRMPSTEYKL